MDVLPKRGKTWGRENLKVRNKKGSNFPALFITNSTIYDDNNILSGIIVFHQTINRRSLKTGGFCLNQYTYELERSNEELEHCFCWPHTTLQRALCE